MISASDVEKPLSEAIVASGLFPRVAWANKDFVSERPYIAVMLVPTVVVDGTMAKTNESWTGFLQITAVTAAGQFETDGRAILANAGGLFAAGTRLTMPNGHKVLIYDHPQHSPPYRDGADYRQPLRIPLRTEPN